jgi:thioredoxin 1
MENITSQELEDLKATNTKLLVDFHADWCNPCRVLAPILESIESDYPNVKFVGINIEENKGYVTSLGIRSIPAVLLYDGLALVTVTIGVKPEKYYRESLELLNE